MLELTDTILKSSLQNANARVHTPLRAPYNPAPQQSLAVYRPPPTSTPVVIRNRPPANQEEREASLTKSAPAAVKGLPQEEDTHSPLREHP